MSKSEIITNNNCKIKRFKIRDIGKIGKFLYFVLDNNQKFIVGKEGIYDISEYSSISDIFMMESNPVAVLSKNTNLCVLDLENKKILLEEETATYIEKLDNKTLKVFKISEDRGTSNIYDITTKSYLNLPDDYEFDSTLGNNLYLFKSRIDGEDFEYKYHVVTAAGNIIFKNITGHVYLSCNNLIICQDEKIDIIPLIEVQDYIKKTVQKNDKIIAKPSYYDGNILIIERNIVKQYTPNFELVKEFPLDGITEIWDYEIVRDILKLYVPEENSENDYGRHIFLNLKTGKTISHLRIEGYPYYYPETFVAFDSFAKENVEYHFYDRDFNKIIDVKADSYKCTDNLKEKLFELKNSDKIQILNTSSGKLSSSSYDYISFHPNLPYGYGIDYESKTMDFFDEDLNIIIPTINYERFNLSSYLGRMSYFIVNNYLCLIIEFSDGCGRSRYRTLVYSSTGELILDSINKQCYPMGKFIQVIDHDNTEFINTVTGSKGNLELGAAVDSSGMINFQKIKNITDCFLIEGDMEENTLKSANPVKQKKNS